MSLPRKRLILVCSPEHECTDDEINEIFVELQDIENDTGIKKYSFPTVVEMRKVLEEAETYTGEWYHSYVVLMAYEQLSVEQKNSEDFMVLYNELAGDFVSEKGVFRSTFFETDFVL